MIGSGMQQGRKVTEEQTVEVVQNHEDGTQGGDRHSHPEGDDELHAAMRGAKRLPESGLRGSYDGGAISGQPQERKPGFAAGSQGPERVGKVGAKVRRVARTCMRMPVSGPIEGPRGPERGDAFQGRGGQQ
jgi:hypothetical protein